jgi:hypothetical protein
MLLQWQHTAFVINHDLCLLYINLPTHSAKQRSKLGQIFIRQSVRAHIKIIFVGE